MKNFSQDGLTICSLGAFKQWPSSAQHSFTPHGAGSRIVKQLTLFYRDYLQKLNQKPLHVPTRILTSPREGMFDIKEGLFNEGFDNKNHDLIIRQNDKLYNSKKNMYYSVKIRNYICEARLGAGTFGQVIKCTIEGTKQQVAIKVIKNSAAFHQQQKIEITVLKTLQAFCNDQKKIPNHIITLNDQFLHKKHCCLVFPLMAQNLLEVIKTNEYEGFTVRLVRKFLQQIATGLAIAEQCGVVHADLKPENIMIQSKQPILDDCELKIIDFGSSCFLNAKHPNIYIQSRFYRAPEIILENHDYTSKIFTIEDKIDIWSLGCIAVELLFGSPLFPCWDQYSCLERIVQVLNPKMGKLPSNLDVNSYMHTALATKRYFDFQDNHYKLKTREQFTKEFPNIQTKEGFNPTHPIKRLSDLSQYYKMQSDSDQPSFNQFLNFVEKCLEWEPKARMSALDITFHPFLTGAHQDQINIEFDVDELFGQLDTQSNPSSTSSFYEVQPDF